MDPLISILIPVYNAERYVEKCLTSVLDQTYTNFEVIVVNDGSNDNSQLVIARLAEQDKRIHHYYQENAGVSSARNRAIQLAHGDWLAFIDADDWIEPTYLADFDIANLSISVLPIQDCTINQQGEININDLTRYSSPCLKLFNRKVILDNDIIFNPSLKVGEDAVFCLNYAKHIESEVLIDKRNYHYRDTPDSASKKTSVEILVPTLDCLRQELTVHRQNLLIYNRVLIGRLLYCHYIFAFRALELHSCISYISDCLKQLFPDKSSLLYYPRLYKSSRFMIFLIGKRMYYMAAFLFLTLKKIRSI